MHAFPRAIEPERSAASLGDRPRVLLIAPHSSYRTAPFLAAAQALGLDVLVASEGKHSLVAAYAEGLHIRPEDKDAALSSILRQARSRPFAGVIATDDTTTELAALAARALGLPHNDPRAVRLARRKDLARRRLARAGVPVPRHRRIDLSRPLAAQIEGQSFPCVLKPLGLSASRGVIRADNPRQLLQACGRVQRILASIGASHSEPETRDYLLVEEFIPGVEVAVEGMLYGGRFELLAIFDKPDPLDGPYFEETYYITPSRLDRSVQADIIGRIAEVCDAYALHEGPVHAECRVNDNGVWILEVAARTIGGLCSRLFQFGTGYSLEQVVLAHAMGQRTEAKSGLGGAGVLMIPTPKAGILRRVEGVTAAQRVPGIEQVSIEVREGYELVPLPEGSSYLGFIFARAGTAEQAENALREAHACLNIVVAPLWKGEVAS